MSKMLTKLKAERDALNERIANFEPLVYSVAVKKLRTYIAEHGMAEEELFPTYYETNSDYETVPESPPEFWEERFRGFKHEDTFGYTFIRDLMDQRDGLDWEIEVLRREAVERAREFIREYKLTEKDVFPHIEK